MKLEYLEEFLLLTQIGNYATTAESLFISESTLSRHILALERELHAELFLHTNRSLVLTAAGEKLVTYAERMLQLMDECANEISPTHTWYQYKLTIGFVRAIMQYDLMDYITRFREENPDISFVMIEGNSETMYKMTKYGDYDVSFAYAYPFLDRSELNVYPIVEDQLAVAVPCSSPLAQYNTLRLEQLRNEQFIVYTKHGVLYNYMLQMFRSAGFRPKVSTSLESRHYILDMVNSGVGIALVEQKRFSGHCPKGVKLLPLEPSEKKYMSLICRSGNTSEPIRRFIHFMQENINTAPQTQSEIIHNILT